MRCPLCQYETPTDAEFCPECGAKLSVVCAQCGTTNAPGHKFCKKCGQRFGAPSASDRGERWFTSPERYTPRHLAEKILTSRSALEGERKQVTVLFADLKGSMELLADRDPEEARTLLDPVLELMMEAVHRYEGTVNQVMGDGIMALFGAPVAHEDHAVRACYAALRMQDSVKRHSQDVRRRVGVPMSIRVGLNSGEVVVRSIGSDLHMDYTAVGQTTHLAARMEQAALPGSIMISPETLRLAEGYVEVKALGPVPVKGLSEPVEVYEVTGAGPVRTRIQASVARGLTRFIGREAELEHLRRALALAGAGHGQVVALVGEAGVGKSRLFYEFARSHRVQGWLILESSSVSYGRATSYLPVVDLLKVYFKIQGHDDHRDIREKVTGKLLTLDEMLKPILPAVLALLDVPVDDPQWQVLDPSQRKSRTLEAVRRLVLRESRERPLVLVFEDLHWIDAETQALLDSLIESLPTTRLLLLLNYRPEYQHGGTSKTYYSQLRLDILPVESTGELLDALLGTDPELNALKQLLLKRGNPFFLEESVRTLVETKALVGERGAYRLIQPVQALQVPATVQAILAARIDRLPADDKRLLQSAAVVGKDIPYVVLQAIVDLPDETVRRGLAHLQAAEFLYETSLFPDLEYTFKHALTHEVTYGTLLQERRRALHARIVDVSERLYTDRLVEHVERLGDHAWRGELWEKAVTYFREAGAKAFARSANEEARRLLTRALGAAQRLAPPLEAATLAQLHKDRANVLAVLTEYDDALVDSEEALRLVREAGDRRHEAPVLLQLSWLHHLNHRVELSLALNEQALVIARECGDQHLEAGCLRDRGVLRAVWWGDVREALADTEAAVQMSERVGDSKLRSRNLSILGAILQWQGDYERALVYLRQGFELASADRDWGLMAAPLFYSVTACASIGEYEEALGWYRQLRDSAFGAEDKFWMARTPNLAGGVHLDLFDFDNAIQLNAEGAELAQKLYRWPEPRGHCLLKLGLAHLYRGDFGAAADSLDRARALLEDDRWLRWRWHIPLLRAYGELALARGRHDEALRFAAESREMAIRTDSRKHIARASWLEGETLAASGRLDEAVPALEASVRLAVRLKTVREIWMGRAGLGHVLGRLGRDRDAEAQLTQASGVIEAISAKLTTPGLRQRFLAAEPVSRVYQTLGRRVPSPGGTDR